MRLRSITTLLLLTLAHHLLPAQEVFAPDPAKHITSFGFKMLTGVLLP
ncbi:hypothetical protein [Paraflavitalea speifideaquila]|nr:hypothetical protein [Paraflavitalea speifideiaquila]